MEGLGGPLESQRVDSSLVVPSQFVRSAPSDFPKIFGEELEHVVTAHVSSPRDIDARVDEVIADRFDRAPGIEHGETTTCERPGAFNHHDESPADRRQVSEQRKIPAPIQLDDDRRGDAPRETPLVPGQSGRGGRRRHVEHRYRSRCPGSLGPGLLDRIPGAIPGILQTVGDQRAKRRGRRIRDEGLDHCVYRSSSVFPAPILTPGGAGPVNGGSRVQMPSRPSMTILATVPAGSKTGPPAACAA